MVDISANQLQINPERTVSAQTLADLFNTAAEGIMRANRGQRFACYVVGFKNQAAIK